MSQGLATSVSTSAATFERAEDGNEQGKLSSPKFAVGHLKPNTEWHRNNRKFSDGTLAVNLCPENCDDSRPQSLYNHAFTAVPLPHFFLYFPVLLAVQCRTLPTLCR